MLSIVKYGKPTLILDEICATLGEIELLNDPESLFDRRADIALLDTEMQGSYELGSLLRNQTSIPFIYTSDDVNTLFQRDMAIKTGASGFCQIPQELFELPGAIASAIFHRPKPISRGRVLVVDDSKTILEMLSASLREFGYTVYTAQEGESAFQMILESNPDILITDHILPGISGIELMKKARSVNPYLPVVAMTGSCNQDVAIEYLRERANDFLKKEFNPSSLHEICKGLVYASRQLRQESFGKKITLGDVIHDINGALCAIRGNAELIVNHKDTTEGLVKKILVQSDELVDKMKSYMVLSQSSGLDQLPVYLDKLFPKVITNASGLYNANKIVITSDIEKDLLVRGDPNLFSGVFLILLKNSIEALTDGGSINIQGWSQRLEAFVDIIDDGPGIPKNYWPFIFKKAFTTKLDGNGIGLDFCRRVMEIYKGKIRYDTNYTSGARFVLTFPKEM